MLCVIVQSHNKDSSTARVLNLIPALFLLGSNALSPFELFDPLKKIGASKKILDTPITLCDLLCK
jgi:hypothetical protein